MQEFGAAYQQWGFAGITGHDIDLVQIKSAMQLAADFFTLDTAVKKRYIGEAGYERGYIPFGTEKAKDSQHYDLKEFFHIGREHEDADHLGLNIWPSEVPGFRASFESLFADLDRLAHRLLEVFALYLDQSQNYFDTRVEQGEAILRILHYPPIVDSAAPHVRAAAHEDINLLTLLVGSEQAGLEVLSRSDEWVPITLIEGTIVCNVGDMLQRLSNGRLPSTTHRVVNPAGDAAQQSRYSMPFFMHPSPEVSLQVLPECVSAERPEQYPAITAGEFLQQRLEEIGLVKKP